MRLINADALKEKKVRCTERHEWAVPVAEIDRMPTIEERKTGKWEQENPFTKPRCSECGEQCFGLHAFDYTLTPYCPNCGAEMDCYMVNSSMFHMSDIMREVVNVPTAGREWLHDPLQDAIDAGIITETQASRLMDRIAEGNT